MKLIFNAGVSKEDISGWGMQHLGVYQDPPAASTPGEAERMLRERDARREWVVDLGHVRLRIHENAARRLMRELDEAGIGYESGPVAAAYEADDSAMVDSWTVVERGRMLDVIEIECGKAPSGRWYLRSRSLSNGLTQELGSHSTEAEARRGARDMAEAWRMVAD